MREIRTTKTEIDLKVPVDTSKIKQSDDGCFGKLWDMSSKECPQCADKDLCSILFKGELEKNSSKIKETLGLNNWLDEADFDAVTDEVLLDFIVSGETTVGELKEFYSRTSKCDDTIAVVDRLKDWIKSRPDVYTKEGIVWKR